MKKMKTNKRCTHDMKEINQKSQMIKNNNVKVITCITQIIKEVYPEYGKINYRTNA